VGRTVVSARAARSTRGLVTLGDSVGPIVTHRSHNLDLAAMIATAMSSLVVFGHLNEKRR